MTSPLTVNLVKALLLSGQGRGVALRLSALVALMALVAQAHSSEVHPQASLKRNVQSSGVVIPKVIAILSGSPKTLPPVLGYMQPASGYVAWFKADAIAGLNDGDPVSSWDDSGPNNKDASQPTTSLKPIYKTNIVNGKPVVRFDGTDDRLVSPAGSGIWGLSNDFTVFAVVRLDTSPGGGGQDVVGSGSISNNLDLIARASDANGNWLAYSSGPDGTRNSDLVLSTDTWYVLTWRLKAASPKHLQIRTDQVYRLNDTAYTGIGTAPSQAAIGARQNGVNPFKGDIAEILFYTGSLSDADMVATEDYLRAKYPPPPAAPSDLTATAVQQRIHLSWMDNSANDDGFRIERREGQNGPFVEMWSVDAGVTEILDETVLASTEYCYRVGAFNGNGDSNHSEVACATTAALTAITCRIDAEDAESGVRAILTNPDLEWWRGQVGLSNANPDDMTLVTNDATCQTLWTAISRRDPYSGDRVTFFKLGDHYIITEYPSNDPNNIAVGYRLTTVVDEQFIQQGPTLAD